ncbi:MAG: class II fructose-bisphosphate aldolase [Candidatus Pacebacteria bacterium]|nr:class II fructose-bisphosphate aldolase [Candidatus Paceibacterota bacterium]
MRGLKDYFKKAEKEKWAMGQFNVSNLEGLKAVFQAARSLKSPVIVGTSEGEGSYWGLKEISHLVNFLSKEYRFPIFLNLDHGKTFDYIKEAIDAGYPAVHFDGSRMDLKENINKTREIVRYSEKKGVFLEGEVGSILGSSAILDKAPQIRAEDLTRPEDAGLFSQETKVKSLAVSIGNFHGVGKSGDGPKIDLQRLKEIKETVGNLPLVLHGGSGIPEDDLKSAIQLGVVKININTELRSAFTLALREAVSSGEIAPYKYLPETIQAVQKVVEEKIRIFGSINKI